MKKVGSKPSSSLPKIQQSPPSSTPKTMKLKGDEHPLSAHIGKKAQEQQKLDQWNTNAQGRNQGLVHLLDYAYARPAKVDTTPPKQKLTPEQTKVLREGDKQGWNEQQWKDKLGEKPFNDLKKQGYFSEFAGDNKVPVGAKASQWQELSGKHEKLSTQLGEAEAKLKDERKAFTTQLGKEGVKGKEVGARMKQWEDGNATKKKVDDLKSELNKVQGEMDAQRRYVLASDVSKRGRLEQIEQSANLPAGSLRHGNEIIGGTDAVQGRLEAASKNGNPMKADAANPSKPLTMNVKQPDGKWKEETVQPEKLSQTFSGKQTVDGITVAKWGLSPDTMKLSTVMGAGKKD